MGLTLFVARVRGRLDARLGVGMFSRVFDRISEMAIVIGGEFNNIVAHAQDRRTVVSQGRIARMQVIEPQEQTRLLVENRVTEAVVQRVEIAAKKLGKIDRLDDGAQHGGATAGAIALNDESSRTDGIGRLDNFVLSYGGYVDQTAVSQLLLHRLRLAH